MRRITGLILSILSISAAAGQVKVDPLAEIFLRADSYYQTGKSGNKVSHDLFDKKQLSHKSTGNEVTELNGYEELQKAFAQCVLMKEGDYHEHFSEQTQWRLADLLFQKYWDLRSAESLEAVRIEGKKIVDSSSTKTSDCAVAITHNNKTLLLQAGQF